MRVIIRFAILTVIWLLTAYGAILLGDRQGFDSWLGMLLANMGLCVLLWPGIQCLHDWAKRRPWGL